MTRAGQHWERLTGRDLEQGGFRAQTPVRKDKIETIKLRNGNLATTRRFDPIKQEWKITKTGKEFYKTLT